ncbi:hypothetical protein GBA52_019505 [Prunus armeniaca]|nr:hypothetical protein GBA52_019505 [Prunus armeniaca]
MAMLGFDGGTRVFVRPNKKQDLCVMKYDLSSCDIRIYVHVLHMRRFNIFPRAHEIESRKWACRRTKPINNWASFWLIVKGGHYRQTETNLIIHANPSSLPSSPKIPNSLCLPISPPSSPPRPGLLAESKMTKLPLVPLVIAALVAALVSPTAAEIKSLTISSDNRPMILFEKFGFTHSGHVTIRVSHVSVTSKLSDIDPSRLGFFLLSEESLLQVLVEIQQNPQLCVLDSRYITRLFNFRELSPPPLSSFNHSYPVSAPNEYSLFFANCAPETTVSMLVRTEVYNLDPDGARDYLSAGLTHLPSLFFVFFLAYLVFVGLLGLPLLHQQEIRAPDPSFDGWAASDEGVESDFRGGGQALCQGHRYRPRMGCVVLHLPVPPCRFVVYGDRFDRDRVLANVASVVIGETGPFIKDWVTWNQVFLLVDIICCCAIIFPIVWSIRSLRETSKTDGKAARNLAKLTLFRQFYIVVIGYLYFTRIVVFALKTIAAYKYQWVSNAAEESASLVFYMVMFYMFRPVERNEYFILDEEEEEAAEMALRDEEFEL